MRGTQPSLTLGPNQAQTSAAAGSATQVSPGGDSAAAAHGFVRQTVQLSGLDSKGRAQAGAFGRAQAGASAPEGGRKPKRVTYSRSNAVIACARLTKPAGFCV